MIIVIMFLVGYLIQRAFVNPIINSPSHNQLLLTLGLSMVIENLILVIFSANYKQYTIASFKSSLSLGPLYLNKPKMVAFLFVIIISVSIFLILNKTDMGRAIRATSVQKDGATLMGIYVNRINGIAFGLGIACAGIAGALMVPMQYIYPTSGDSFQLKCFVIAVFGGLGNIGGAIAAGLIIGIVESVSALAFGGSWSSMVIYLIFILTLLLRPTGLFGKKA
jgi:branched-chain amino acid transport system permease protein